MFRCNVNQFPFTVGGVFWYRFVREKYQSFKHILFYFAQTLEKWKGHIALRLSVRPVMCPFKMYLVTVSNLVS